MLVDYSGFAWFCVLRLDGWFCCFLWFGDCACVLVGWVVWVWCLALLEGYFDAVGCDGLRYGCWMLL